jgi:hypothetical protein
MPRLSVWFIRLAFLHLAVGLTIGGLILADKGFPFLPWLWNLLPAHMEILLLGWMAQLALGVAFWILPRFGTGLPRGDERPIWISLLLLNVGILLVSVQPFLPAERLALAGRILEGCSIVLFAVFSWKRVKPLQV